MMKRVEIPSGEFVTILLVEDNMAHAELVIRSFEGHNMANKIYHVTNGEEALDYLYRRRRYANPKHSPRPHMILLDLHLPKVTGIEVLAQIKSTPSLKKIPVVVLTTSAAEWEVDQAYEHHANSYVVKPLDFEKFKPLMEELGYYWLGWNHGQHQSDEKDTPPTTLDMLSMIVL